MFDVTAGYRQGGFGGTPVTGVAVRNDTPSRKRRLSPRRLSYGAEALPELSPKKPRKRLPYRFPSCTGR